MRCRCWALDEGALAWPHLLEKKEKKKAPSQEAVTWESSPDSKPLYAAPHWRHPEPGGCLA